MCVCVCVNVCVCLCESIHAHIIMQMENNLKHTTGCHAQDQCRAVCLNHSRSIPQPSLSSASPFLSSIKREIKPHCFIPRWYHKHLCRLNYLGKETKLMRELLIRSYLEFCQQYRLHCRWDKISLEGTSDLQGQDSGSTAAQHSDPRTLQGKHSPAQTEQWKDTVCVFVWACMDMHFNFHPCSALYLYSPHFL